MGMGISNKGLSRIASIVDQKVEKKAQMDLDPDDTLNRDLNNAADEVVAYALDAFISSLKENFAKYDADGYPKDMVAAGVRVLLESSDIVSEILNYVDKVEQDEDDEIMRLDKEI